MLAGRSRVGDQVRTWIKVAATTKSQCRCIAPAISTRCASYPAWTGNHCASATTVPAPLRDLATKRPPDRAPMLRRFAERGDRHGIAVWTIYNGTPTPRHDEQPRDR